MAKSEKRSIAIIGMSCWYPGAKNVLELWENVLAKRQQFRRMLDTRMPLADYQSDDKAARDKTYGKRASFLEGFEFDWNTNRFPKSTYDSTDVAHWLALDVAIKALRDAGMDRNSIPQKKTGVLIGNSLTGETSRADNLRLRWPYIEKVLRAVGSQRGFSQADLDEFVAASEGLFKSSFAPVTEDSLAGTLSNTIAGRVCNYLNVDGGGYTVDGACASSLLAIANSASSLVAGDLDMALAGGVDVSLDPTELVGFAKVGALTDSEMRVFDRDGKGFIPSEGCGFVVMKRLEDALRDGNKIYAVLNGWGISSDGSGGITAPKASGQAIAIERAYAKAGYPINSCDFIEAHGTGTAVGDRRELEGLSLALARKGDVSPRTVGVTSLKSIIGHSKAAAGIGSFIKAVVAVNRRILPPTAGCENRNPVFDENAIGLYPLVDGETRSASDPIRAGISSFGFGGINCHLTIESYGKPQPCLQPHIDEQVLMSSHSDAELFIFTAQSLSSLREQIKKIKTESAYISVAELADLAFDLLQRAVPTCPYRAALVAASPSDLTEKLDKLEALTANVPGEGHVASDELANIWFSNKAAPPRVGFLFPGQGSQKINMSRAIKNRFEWAARMVADADQTLRETVAPSLSQYIFKAAFKSFDKSQVDSWVKALSNTEVAQPAICLASLLWAKRLSTLGIECHVAGGHSLGELTALCWAGAFDEHKLLETAALRGQLMAAKDDGAGTMVSLNCDATTAGEMVAELNSEIAIANINGPQQTVMSGTKSQVEEIIKLAASKNINSSKLNVSNAFHSPLVYKASEKFRNLAKLHETAPFRIPVISGVHGKTISVDMKLNDYLADQIMKPVNFIGLVSEMNKHCDFIFEVGPSAVLSGLVRNINSKSEPKCYPVESKPEKQFEFLKALGAYFAAGGHLVLNRLFENRLVRQYVPFAQKQFIVNPCEKAFPSELAASIQPHSQQAVRPDLATPTAIRPAQAAAVQPALRIVQNENRSISMSTEDVLQAFVDILATITGFQKSVFKPEMRLLDDLNMDSIKAGESIALLAKKCSLQSKIDPLQTANATIGEIVNAVMKLGPHSQSVASGAVEALTLNSAVAPSATTQKQTQAEVSSQSAKSVQTTLHEILAKITGFDLSVFKPEMRLLDDLNLDSLKAGEVIVTLKKAVNGTDSIDPLKLANATLNEIVTLFESSSTDTPNPSSSDSVLPTVLRVIGRLSGYAHETLRTSMKLESDLRIGENQLTEIVSECSRALGIHPTLDLQSIRNCTIEKLASIFESIKTAQSKRPEGPEIVSRFSNHPSWVRDFKQIMVKTARAEMPTPVRLSDQWPHSKVLYLHSDALSTLDESLIDLLNKSGASCVASPFDGFEASKFDLSDFSHVILSFSPDGLGESLTNRLRRAVARFRFLSNLPTPKNNPRRHTTLACIHRGDGHFGLGKTPLAFDQSSSRSFLQTIQLENPGYHVRSLDIAIGLDVNYAAEQVLLELNGPETCSAVGFDVSGERLTPTFELIGAKATKPRKIKWKKEDVVIVTGGARGITAECALTFAKETGVRLALIGSSPLLPEAKDAEIQSNLERFRSAGVEFKYYACDVSDDRSVETVLKSISTDLGEVSGLIHGAAKNIPRRLRQVSEEQAMAEIAPKVMGAFNILSRLDPTSLKFVCGFTSIIGAMGVPGNGWYGFSNEVLNFYLQRYKDENPSVEVIACAFGMWDEVGMASKLGSGKRFSASGLSLIPVREGVSHFMKFAKGDSGDNQVIITSRLWHDSPLAARTAGYKKYRFLENIVANTKNVEVISHAHLRLESDLYLKDHCYNGSYILPTVFGLEAMAQAAALCLGLDSIDVLIVEDLLLNSAIVVNPAAGVEIEIYCQVLEHLDSESRAKVGIRTEHSNFAQDSFSATFRLPKRFSVSSTFKLPIGGKLAVDVQRDIYKQLMFHGPEYQNITGLFELNSKSTVFELKSRPSSQCVKSCFTHPEGALILGDPFARDCLLQAAQMVLTKNTVLPSGCRTWSIRTSGSSRVRVGQFSLEELSGKTFKGGVVCLDESGDVVEEIISLTGVSVRPTPENPTGEQIAGKVIDADPNRLHNTINRFCSQRGFESPTVIAEIIPGFAELSPDDRHTAELRLLKKAMAASRIPAEIADKVELRWEESGKPKLLHLDSPRDISFSHSGNICICVLSPEPTGCDFERISSRSADDWRLLLGPSFQKVFNELETKIKDVDLAGTCVWAAREAAAKLIQQKDIEFSSVTWSQDGVQFETKSADQSVLVYSMIIPQDDDLKGHIFAVALPHKVLGQSEGLYNGAFLIDANPKNFRIRWPVTFKEASNTVRTVYFSRFFEWAGRARELAIYPLLGDAKNIFSAGEFGWVTNEASTEYFGALEAGDQVEVRMSSSAPHGSGNSTVDVIFDWYRVDRTGGEMWVARTTMLTTWVKIKGHGVVEVAPFPEQFRQFFMTVMSTDDRSMPVRRTDLGGASIYQAPEGIGLGPILATQVFETSLEDSNLVGNIYYSNYSTWQGRVRDGLFNRIAPELFRTPNRLEPFCVFCHVKHLRESMPFDQVEVTMRLQSLEEKRIGLYFEYYQFIDGVRGGKIAYSNHYMIWSETKKGVVTPIPLPEKIMRFLKSTVFENSESIQTKKAA